MKKKKIVVLVILLLIIIIGLGVYVYFKFIKPKPVEQQPTVFEVTNQIDSYGYTLEDRDTELFKTNFEELKSLLNEEDYDKEKYVSLVSKLFIIDLYTIDNKISRYDVGGLEYVYSGARESLKSVAEDSIYKTVENNIDKSRTQKLPEVSSIEVSSVETYTFKMPDDTTSEGYKVKLSWEYKESLGYDTSGTIVVIPDGELKYGVVYFN